MPQPWPLDKIDIEACAKVWGLPEPVPFTTCSTIYGSGDSRSGRYFFLDTAAEEGIDVQTGGVAIWLNPTLVDRGFAGPRYYSLLTYAHEVAHALTQPAVYGGDNAGHDIEFAAVFAFLLSRIPFEGYVSDHVHNYDVHETTLMSTPFRGRGTGVRRKAWKYARRIAINWGWELAQDPALTAPQAVKIIRQWDRERLAGIDRRELIEDRLTFAALGVAALAGLGYWLWKITRPLI